MAIFPIPNWVFYFANYMDVQSIGMIDGVSILIGVVAEVPSGAFSDMVGKKRTLILGYLLLFFASIIIAFSTSIAAFFIGNSILFIGYAFISGAQEALAYDSLLEKGKEIFFAKVSSVYGVLSVAALLIAMAVGGFAYQLGPNIPWILYACSMLIAVIICITLTEPAVDSEVFSLKNYFKQMIRGINAIFSKDLRRYVILILLLSGVIELGQGVIRQITGAYFGFDGETFGYLLSVMTMIAILFVYRLDNLLKIFKESGLLILLLLIIVIAYLIAYITNSVGAGVVVFFLLSVAGRISAPLISVVVNHKINSKDRATSISTLSLLKQIPYILTVIFFANYITIINISSVYLIIVIVLSVLLLVGVIVNRIYKK